MLIKAQSPSELVYFQTVIIADNTRLLLITASKRSSPAADPMHVSHLNTVTITRVINSSLLSGVVPSTFKSATVRPIRNLALL